MQPTLAAAGDGCTSLIKGSECHAHILEEKRSHGRKITKSVPGERTMTAETLGWNFAKDPETRACWREE